MPVRQIERHRTGRVGWLRAAVLGANDGIQPWLEALEQRVPAVEPGLDGLDQHHVSQGEQRNRTQQRQR
jgi:hypothetical protein